MAMDLSLRHLPDISEASSLPDFPDASFQIPRATNSTADYLLMAEPSDFLAGVGSETLTSPVKPTPRVHHVPLTLQELTPRTRRLRAAPIHSSLKRHVIPSPLKNAIARDLSVAINETLSPAKPRDLTFAIPMLSTPMTNLLEDDSFLQKARGVDTTFPEQSGSQRSHSSPLTLSQLTPTTSKDSDISPPPPPKYSLQIFQKEYDSLVNTSGSDTEATRLHNSPGMSSEPVIAEDKSSPPLSGLTTGPESSHALPDKPVGEGGLSAENVYKVERLKLARPAGSNTAHREKLKATKRVCLPLSTLKFEHSPIPCCYRP